MKRKNVLLLSMALCASVATNVQAQPTQGKSLINFCGTYGAMTEQYASYYDDDYPVSFVSDYPRDNGATIELPCGDVYLTLDAVTFSVVNADAVFFAVSNDELLFFDGTEKIITSMIASLEFDTSKSNIDSSESVSAIAQAHSIYTDQIIPEAQNCIASLIKNRDNKYIVYSGNYDYKIFLAFPDKTINRVHIAAFSRE